MGLLKIKKTWVLLGTLVVPFLVLFLFLFLVSSSTEESACSVPDVEDESTSINTSSALASDSDWTKEGTTAYQNAKKVFKAFVNHGTSGAFSAGVVGWVNSEGGFGMIGRAEGHYGNDIKTNSIAYGVTPRGLSYYTTEAGGGIFQFTPFTKYAPLGSPDWENADKMIAFVMKTVASGDWNASMDLTGKNHSFADAVKLTDPKQATLTWQAYERGSVAHINQAQKQADAQKAYELFDGGKYQYDEAKFRASFGKKGDSSNVSMIASTDSNDSELEDCTDMIFGGETVAFSGEFAPMFNVPFTVVQPYGRTPWSLGGGAWMYPMGRHSGVDLQGVGFDKGDVSVFSVTDGTVSQVNPDPMGGFYIVIKPKFEGHLYYGHMKSSVVKTGQKIKAGEKIGVMGTGGGVYHVHFEYNTDISTIGQASSKDKDPSFLLQKSGTVRQDQKFNPKK
ncbi:phage tail tip lysozyme [Streptococcus pluranimalium]|uniref:phage tail tip lysozyme n=1 Tax=Streptococcus pluranimalium TaxID=82348 RepID=UPI003F69357C